MLGFSFGAIAEAISVILYEGPKYSGKLISSPSGATNRFQFNHMLKFYLGLKKNIQKKIKFKSPPYTRLRYNSSSKLINLLGNNKIYKSNDSLKKVIINSKILVCTYPQTTFLEILLSQKPFIILIPKKFWSFHKDNQKILDKLVKKKIAFYDEKKASQHLNKNWKKINEWWNSRKIKLVRKELMEKNFNFKINNSNDWENFFNKLI